MILYEARQHILFELKDNYDESEATNIAGLVLEKVSGLEIKEQRITKDLFLSSGQTEVINKIIHRLKQNEPVQYVLEEAWFGNIRLKVNKTVLIPRPETEELVEWIKQEAASSKLRATSVLDIGTGSGCIAIALKKKLPQATVSAIDVSGEALLLAKENALAFETEIEFILLDFLDEEKWNELGKYDIIVSNPPYVKQQEKETMHTRVTAHEPHLALFVPDNDALMFYRKLADFSLGHLSAGGYLFVEINESSGKEVAELFQKKGFKAAELKKDMQGKDRMLKVVFSS